MENNTTMIHLPEQREILYDLRDQQTEVEQLHVNSLGLYHRQVVAGATLFLLSRHIPDKLSTRDLGRSALLG
jgi:hypothetical protein